MGLYTQRMTTTVLTTKFHFPSLRSQVVARSRLIESLNSAFQRKLTLVSAPAGFGKTTLVSEWLAVSKHPAAWLSLDKADRQIPRFLTYLVHAVRQVHPHLGTSILEMLQSQQSPPSEIILTILLNELVQHPVEFVLILDDYHLISSPLVDNALAFLLEHLPPQIHLIVVTREDPDLALARLRSRGELHELRANDLRFTATEAREFLNRRMGLKLSENDIQALLTRTEGWIAGLQLAAISMQGKAEVGAFIQSFTGNHRFVMDYLLEEVLEQQTPAIQTFLLYTSILDRFCGELCEALIPDLPVSGQEMLEYLEKANLFLIPLDDARSWYRYHHLFADLLRQRLERLANYDVGIRINELHIRASEWHEKAGWEIEAFHHATLANDIDRAERLIAGNGMPLHFRGAGAVVMSWLSSLPETVLEERPSLWITHAMVLTFSGQPLQDIHSKLQAVEALLKNRPQDQQTKDLIGQIAAIRAMLAIPHNEIDIIAEMSKRALEFLHPDNLPVRTNSAWTLAYAYQVQGNYAAANQAYADVIRISEASNNLMAKHAAMLGLGTIQEAQNQLHRASATFLDAIRAVGDPSMPTLCTAHWSLAKINYEWNELEIAQNHALESIRLGQMLKTVEVAASGHVVLARIHFARGKLEEAITSLQAAEEFLNRHNFTQSLSEIAAERVRIALRKGDFATAAQLAESDDIPLSRVRVQLAQGKISTALENLSTLSEQSIQEDQVAVLLRVRVLQVVALQLSGQIQAAVETLKDALLLAEQGGFIRLFVDEGLPMKQVLSQALAQGMMQEYVRKILAAFDTTANGYSLIEPLSERELEILKLVAEGRSNREISEQLFLALDTVKGHNRRIYAKLQVQRRTEAIARARELGLL